MQENQNSLIDVFVRLGIPNNVHVCGQIADWAYNQTYMNNGLTWVFCDQLEKLPATWNISLAPLKQGLL